MPTPIIIKTDDTVINANLNDTVAAQDLKKRLPINLVGYRSNVDYCCSAVCSRFDPTETQSGWKNGDINLAGGWFAIFFDGEEESKEYRGMMIVAHIEKEELKKIKELHETVKFCIELANK